MMCKKCREMGVGRQVVRAMTPPENDVEEVLEDWRGKVGKQCRNR